MSGLIGFETARRALTAHRQAMDVIAHNVANANTEGFSRQRVNLKASPPLFMTTGASYLETGQIGTGVDMQNVTRIRDKFLDYQFRDQNASAGRWQMRESVLAQVEEVFNEPSDSSLQMLLDGLWSGWQTLAANPESMAARESLVQKATALVEALRQYDKNLSDMQRNLDNAVGTKVKEINLLGEEIVSLNERIAYSTGVGLEANDLKDQRDLLLDRLSRLVGITVLDGPNDTVRVLLNGVTLIDGTRLNRLTTDIDPSNSGFLKIQWEDFSSAVEIKDGEIGACLELRDVTIQGYRDKLKQLAYNLAKETNDRHQNGFGLDASTGLNFFYVDPSFSLPSYPPEKAREAESYRSYNLQSLAVSQDVLADVRRIAAASQPSPGDGSNALNVADLKRTPLSNLKSFTPDDFYRSLISSLGVESREAKQMHQGQQMVVDRIANQREAVSGVNLDEEMMDLIRFQHAFNAAARLVTVMDENLSMVINRMGAGR